MNEPKLIKDVNDIDLNKHGIIEASAGTGKTYTIKKLFVRILLEKKVEIEQILVMTFTEKATAELKKDIRENIKDALKNETDEYNKKLLKKAVSKLDKAEIYTLHGFCNSLINNFPFENSLYFKNSIIDDSSIYERMFYQLIRNNWKEEYSNDLLDILIISNFNEMWKNKLIQISTRYLEIEPLKDLLLPEYDQNFVFKIHKIKKEIKNLNLNHILNKLDLNGVLDISTTELNELIEECIAKNSVKKYKEMLNSFIIFLNSEKTFYDCWNFVFNFNKEYSQNYIIESVKKDKLHFFLNNKKIIIIKETIEKILDIFKEASILSNQLFSNSIVDLKNAVINYKKERGLLSFDDLLKIVYFSLTNENDFRKKVQNIYKYALIDEFQDTDKIQWEILKKIFIESKNNILFLIGDPKQSIYSFRGADIYTYLKARETLLKSELAEYYFINTNYRSNKDIVETLNILFGFTDNSMNNWFSDNKIPKIPSIPYHDNIIIINNETERLVNLIKLEDEKVDDIYFKLKLFIVNEIKKLLNFELIDNKKNEKRKVNLDDIAILTRKVSEQLIIEEALKNANLPCSIYKKGELYKSEEAFNLYILLDAISDPLNDSKVKKALFTEFFNVTPEYILNSNENTIYNTALNLIKKWNHLANERKWANLFLSIIEDTGIFLNIKEKEIIDRKITNYKHIIEKLLITAEEKDITIFDLVNTIYLLINKETLDIDSDLHRIETDESRIKIMTIHAAKGLQFPIVFIFAGISKDKNEPYYKFYDDKLDKIVFDLTKDEKNKEKFENERKKEDERLYYVALTRAIARLYIPYIQNNRKTKSTFIELINKNINFLIESKKVNFIDVNLETRGSYNKKEIKNFYIPRDFLTPLNLNPLKDEIFSFSSLILNKEKTNEFSSIEIDYNIKEDDENTISIIPKDEILPGSIETGLIFHEIMKEINFEKINENLNNLMNDLEINRLIEEKIKKFIPYSYKIKEEKIEPIKNELINIIHCTLNKNLGVDNIILKDIPEKNIIKEFQFYYILEKEKQNYYINGIIDLFFKHNNKYYLLDWKTNKLDSYDKEKLEIEMKNKNYFLQLKIYYISIIKWLSKKISDFNYEENFGGIFYLFVRGINYKNNEGIFFYKPPSISFMEEYLAELRSISLGRKV